MEKIKNYIGGEFADPTSGRYLNNYNPSRGAVYSLVADSTADDINRATQAAQSAQSAWGRLAAEDRAQYLRRLSDEIMNHVDELARAEAIDNGKPIAMARELDIPRSAKNFRFFADAVTQFHGEFFNDTHSINTVVYDPLGVVGVISPWNLPLYLLTWKIAPALAMGNTVVAKPSEITPYTAFRLAQIADKIGLPAGVLNIVHGAGAQAGQALVEHPDIKAISFTGSTATGRVIAKLAAPQFKKYSLEMGGKNPNIIFADCDFDLALKTTLRSTFSNQGQICLCGSRILIEKSLYEKFRDALVDRANSLRLGDPLDESTEQGSVVSEAHMNKVLGYVERARHDGGVILCGGERARLSGEIANGYYIRPTLIEGLSPECSVNQDEIFGPVATLIPFENECEAVAIANSTRYGLSASVWSQDVSRCDRVANALQAGVVWVNSWMVRDLRTPFGGVKESGVGREGGDYGLRFFSDIKTISRPAAGGNR